MEPEWLGRGEVGKQREPFGLPDHLRPLGSIRADQARRTEQRKPDHGSGDVPVTPGRTGRKRWIDTVGT